MICVKHAYGQQANGRRSEYTKRLTLRTALACDAVAEWDECMRIGDYESARAAIVSHATVVCQIFGREEFEKMWWASIERQYKFDREL